MIKKLISKRVFTFLIDLFFVFILVSLLVYCTYDDYFMDNTLIYELSTDMKV